MRFLSDQTVQRLREVVEAPDLANTPYTLVAPLARGGMATVYLARDDRLDREVALKVLQHADPEGSIAARMLREARIIARLEHPGIVPVHDVGTLSDGRVYYAMKRVRGEGLLGFLRGAATLAERLRVFQRICEAVAFAHANGVVHRDLKPENVMVGPFGEVLVMDWGLAKHLGEEPGVATSGVESPEPDEGCDRSDTSHGTILGTPGYMPPEQARGELHRVDARADVYALGVVLFTMLTGRHPAREVDVATAISTPPLVEATPRAQAETSPTHLRSTDAGLPKALEAVCAKATAAEPEGRYADAGELGTEVSRFLDGLPVVAHRESIVDRLLRWGRKYRTPIALVLTYLLIRVAILVLLGR